MPAEIPGFHWDAEKGKYFRIQASHTAPPAGAKYTRQALQAADVRARKQEQADQQQEWLDSWNYIERHALQRSSAFFFLNRSIGNRKQIPKSQLWRQKMTGGSLLGSWRARTMGPVVSLAFDSVTGSLSSLSLGSMALAGHFEGPKVTLHHTVSEKMVPTAVKNLAYLEVSTMCRALNGTIVIGGTDAVHIWDTARDLTDGCKSVSPVFPGA